MTQESVFIIALKLRQEGNLFYITSPDMSGLNVCGDSVEGTYQSVVKVVEALFEHNWGFKVEVYPATTDGKSFPKCMELCDQLAVRKVA